MKKALEIVRKYLPEWKLPEDFNLDAEALNQLSNIIRLQEEWLKHQSSQLYVDPLLIEVKVRTLEGDALAEAFMRSWHPIVTLEQLSLGRIKEAVEYWNQLAPLEERWRKLPQPPRLDFKLTTIDELIRLRLLTEVRFNGVMNLLWQELKEKAKGTGKVDYWDFVVADTYEGTVTRAYLTSFLVTYGYAALEVLPLEEEAFIIPFQEPRQGLTKEQSVSIPLSMDYETWMKMRRKGENE